MDIGLDSDCASIVAVTIAFANFVDPDDVWRAAVATATGRLGEPAAVGMHDEHWHHAIWRSGDALLALVQGENLDTHGFWTRRHSGWCRTRPTRRCSPGATCTRSCGDPS